VPWEPWATFSATGHLGIAWRAQHPDLSYDVWTATSADGGRTFTLPVRLNAQPSPAPNFYLRVGGDDTTGVALGAGRLLVSWGDWRGSHGEDVWWGGYAVPGA
jgi:hypothetical protein